MNVRSLDQRAVRGRTELALAEEFVDIANRYSVKVTLLVSGLAAIAEPDRVRRLASNTTNVELGAHDYDPFDPESWPWVRSRLLRRAYGSVAKQRDQIRNAREAFAEVGVHATSWSGHAYRYDRHTCALLREQGFTHAASVPNRQAVVPSLEGGVVVIPINTTPDHDHVIHRNRIPASVSVRPLSGEQWRHAVEREINEISSMDGVATLRVHPVCMAAVDEFATFERLCQTLGGLTTVLMSELGATKYSRIN